MPTNDPHIAAARIVHDAGGQLVGRTRLQKIAFLMELGGFGDDFSFEYRHYGPYSEELAQAMEIAVMLGPVNEDERLAEWGGKYSVYSIAGGKFPDDQVRSAFVREAKQIDAVELELAATAAYIYEIEGVGKTQEGNPWHETRRRKQAKAANGRLANAVRAYERLRAANTPRPLPELPSP